VSSATLRPELRPSALPFGSYAGPSGPAGPVRALPALPSLSLPLLPVLPAFLVPPADPVTLARTYRQAVGAQLDPTAARETARAFVRLARREPRGSFSRALYATRARAWSRAARVTPLPNT
jgi:hypothetical protein